MVIQKWEIDAFLEKYPNLKRFDTVCWGSNGMYIGPTKDLGTYGGNTSLEVFDCATETLDVGATGRLRNALDIALAPEPPRYGGGGYRKRRITNRRRKNKQSRKVRSHQKK